MSKHLKRLAIPRSWPIQRKNKKYIIKPRSKSIEKSLPIAVFLRDILKIARTMKEVKYILNNKEVYVDKKIIKDPKFGVSFYDIISIPKINKNYRVEFSENGKINFKEIKPEEAEIKILKVIGKKILRKNKLQINCHDGKNFIFNEKVKVGDSIILDLKKNRILRILPFKEKAKVFIIGGKHTGKKGKIEEISKGGKQKIIKIKIEKKLINTTERNVFVIE